MVLAAKTRKRVRYHHGNLPAALVEAAGELIEEHGREGVTLRAVARHVGVTHAAPYRHFQDKAALLAAVAEASFVRLTGAMAAARRKRTSAAAGLEAAGRAYLQFATEQSARFRLMFDEQPGAAKAPGETGVHDTLRAEIEHGLATLAAEVSAQMTLPPASMALLLWSQWHGLSLIAVERGPSAVAELAELLTTATRLLTRAAGRYPLATTVPAPVVTVIPAGSEDR